MSGNLHAEKIFHGTPVSRGIAIGPIHALARGFAAPEVRPITENDVTSEQQRLSNAINKTKQQLTDLQQRMEQLSGREEGLVFEAHSMILDDPGVTMEVMKSIKTRLQNAEFCFYAVMQTYLESMRRISDAYINERTIDIEDVCQRVLRNFTSEDATTKVPDQAHLLVTYDLTPSDTASMDRSQILGFVTESGSINSHTAILARALGIPAIVGLGNALLDLVTLTPAILDGYTGDFIIHPTPETLERYQKQASERRIAREALEALKDQESNTRDGRHITLSANIEFTHELDTVRKQRAEGVGLFRTEFFLLESSEYPNEDKQTEIYTELATGVKPSLGIIRTLDSGGDKLPAEPLIETEPNPFLGWRGIRVSLDRQDIFKDQLRAILRASTHGKLGMMFPFISGVSELRECRKLVKNCMAELDQKGIAYDADLQIGTMIEIPSAVLVADELAKESDFFSIGTNDLIQYTVAVDRINHRVSKLYRSTHPAVIRFIKMTTDAAKQADIWTGICGEMAADLKLMPLLIGLGVDELSVGPQELAPVRKALLSLDYSECQALAEEALRLPTAKDIMDLTTKAALDAYPDLLERKPLG